MRNKFLIIFFFLFINSIVNSIAKEYSKNPLFWELNLSGLYGFDYTTFNLANSSFKSVSSNLWGNYYDVSIGVNLYRKKNIRIGLDFGYKQEHFHFSKSDISGGVFLNAVPLHLYVSFFSKYLTLGVRSDIIVDYKIKDTKNFSYVGFNRDCFNNFTMVPYMAFNFPLIPDLGFSFRINYHAISIFNQEKINYYNMRNNTLNNVLSFEFGITYRIFTNGRRNDVSTIFRQR